jgi:hypothetical protein
MGVDRAAVTPARASKADPVAVLCQLADTPSAACLAAPLREGLGASIDFLVGIGALVAGAATSIVTCRACDADCPSSDHLARLGA